MAVSLTTRARSKEGFIGYKQNFQSHSIVTWGNHKELKARGFRGTSTMEVFQEYRGSAANYWAKTTIENHYRQKQEADA